MGRVHTKTYGTILSFNECRVMAEELLSFGGLAAEVFFKQSNAWYLVRNFMMSIVVLVNSFYCVHIKVIQAHVLAIGL